MGAVSMYVVRSDGSREAVRAVAGEDERGTLRLSSFVTASDGAPLVLHPGDSLELPTLEWRSIG